MEDEQRVLKSALRKNSLYSSSFESSCTFIRVEPKSKTKEESETTDNTDRQKDTDDDYFKLKRRAKKSVTFVPFIPKICREIPGCLRANSVSSYFCSFGMKLKGHNYIRKKMEKYNSTVFRMNYFGPRIVICDHEGIQFLLNENLVQKQCRFGTITTNQNIVKGYVPFEFTDGVLHNQTRDFIIEHFKSIGKNCREDVLSKIIADEFNWMTGRVLETKDFEDVVGNCMSNLITHTILGTRLDYTHIKNWYNYLISPVSKKDSVRNEGMRSSEVLLKQIEQSPIGIKLVKYGEKHNIDTKEILMELLPMLAFNGWKSLASLLLSIMVYLVTSVSKNQRIQLQYEAMRVLKYKEGLDVLFHIENFILEVIRLHPPAKCIFGIANEAFIMDSQCGLFKVQKGEQLCGDIYWTQRDPEIFEDPDVFDFERFAGNPELANFIFAFGGNFHEAPRSFHKCIAQHFSLKILKLCVCHLMYSDIKASCRPKWTGRKYWRLSASDKPFTVHDFKYKGVT